MDKTKHSRQFASDNWSGICPEAFEALRISNVDHVHAYGDDAYTKRACEQIREFFETDCEVFFTFNGTAANSLALATMCQSYHSIICHELAHIETDECGAPQFFSNGTKTLAVSGDGGKVNLEAVEDTITKRTDIHYPQPHVLSLTQATELGTLYTVDEVKAAWELASKYGLKLHMDGARFANALASLQVMPKEITWEVGVDVLCFGGTKLGMPVGDAVVFFDRDLASEFAYRCKQAGQLASKMRFIAAPWSSMLESGALLRHAENANARAQELHHALQPLQGVEIMYPREANSVFLRVELETARKLRDLGWYFYEFIGDGGIRLMCSWDTTSADVKAIVADLESCLT